MHDQLVKSRKKVATTEAENQQMKMEQEVVANEKAKDFDDRKILE